jgi:hypothetical protein
MNNQQLMLAVRVSVLMLIVLRLTHVTVTEQSTIDACSLIDHFDG